jgi:hypothetical protein
VPVLSHLLNFAHSSQEGEDNVKVKVVALGKKTKKKGLMYAPSIDGTTRTIDVAAVTAGSEIDAPLSSLFMTWGGKFSAVVFG